MLLAFYFCKVTHFILNNQIFQMIFILSCLEYYPRHDFLVFLMRMLGIIAYIMRFAIGGGAIETVALASGDFC